MQSEKKLRINIRSLLKTALLAVPCIIAALFSASGNTFPDINGIFIKSASGLNVLIFALAAALILPSNHKKWMILGTTIACFSIQFFMPLVDPYFSGSVLSASFLSPLAAMMVTPNRSKKRHGTHRPTFGESIVNYLISIIFVILISAIMSSATAIFHYALFTWISKTYVSNVYESGFFFVYGLFFQLSEPFGFSDFVSEIISIDSGSIQSKCFYAATIIMHTAALPAMFIALGIHQRFHSSKIRYYILAVISLAGSISGNCTAFMIIALFWLAPSYFALYLILAIAVYYLAGMTNFNMTIIPHDFYNPDVIISKINFAGYTFPVFLISTFAGSLAATLFVLKINEPIDHLAPTMNKTVQQLRLDINWIFPVHTQDYSLAAVRILISLGGYNNVISITSDNKDHLYISVWDVKQTHEEMLKDTTLISKEEKNGIMIFNITIEKHAREIYDKMLQIAQHMCIDISLRPCDVPSYNINNSIFKNQFKQSKEQYYALDTN